jgi:ATP-dependent Clp protease ATP-binding subunit ClpC
MKNNFFISWYYIQGLNYFIRVEENLIRFLWRFFSIEELLLHLLSPWKRDVAARNWRGFQLSKSFERFVGNMLSRVVGAAVRIIVAIFGLSIITIFIIVSVGVILLWIFPFFVILSALLVPLIGFIPLILISLLFIIYSFSLFVVYRESTKIPYSEMELIELAQEPFFYRVLDRIGKNSSQINEEIWIDSEKMNSFLSDLDISSEEFQKIINWEIIVQENRDLRGKFWSSYNLDKIPSIGSQWQFAYTVNLDRYALDITKNDPTTYRNEDLIGRENELNLLKLILNRPGQNNVLLVGGSGSGRLTLIHYLAKQIRNNVAEDRLLAERILIVNLGEMVSDAAEGHVVEHVLHQIFREATRAGNVILVIEDIENYLGKDQGTIHLDIADVMKEYLSYPTFQVIATSTPKEYHRLIEKHEGFMKHFEVVEMREPDENQSLDILLQEFSGQERDRVIFTYKALQHIVTVSGQIKWSVPLPERAIDLAEEVLMYWQSNAKTDKILIETVDEFLSMKTGSPRGAVAGDEKVKLLNLEAILHKRVIGQVEAIKQVAEAMRRARSGINDPKKPLGSFLFLGPTGVGKTETAKALAEGYFGDEEKMIRLDMSEYQNPGSIDRLLGSQISQEPGKFITDVKDNPFSLILLDEIEKAYPDILNIFLQILDEGFVTDALGEKINFRNNIIIATSNAGAPYIKKMVEEGMRPELLKHKLIDQIVNDGIFRLEFLNRFNGTIFFRPLNRSELDQVVDLMLKKLSRRIIKEKHIDVVFEDTVADQIIKQGYEPMFGARSVNRFIEDKIEDVIARKIISGEIKRGERINITMADLL